MANNAAMHLHDELESFAYQLDTFDLMASMGMATKEACAAMTHELAALQKSLNDFNAGNAKNDGQAKHASSSLSQHIGGLYRLVANDAPQPDIHKSSSNFKTVLAQARRTWLSREALNRMTIK